MLWWPAYAQTWVLPLDAPAASALIAFHTAHRGTPTEEELPKGKPLFTGVVKPAGVSILSRRVDYPENALPRMRLELTDTPRGCILVIHYQLFLSSLIFLVFWSLVCLVITLYLWWGKGQAWSGLAALALGLFNYLFFMVSFNRQISKSTRALQEVFEDLLPSED